MKPKHSFYWKEWARKAEIDNRAAQRLWQDCRHDPEQAEVCCFHVQQCVEKYFKAILASQGRATPKTHDLAMLISEIKKAGMNLSRFEEDAYILNDYAIDTRYPGSSAAPAEARLAVRKMKVIVAACKLLLKKSSPLILRKG